MDKNTAIVIVPVYNRRHLICRCLDSIKEQGYSALQLIVVDNASTDDTATVVREWINRNPVWKYPARLLTENLRGAAAARQHGVQWVASLGMPMDSVIFFFDSDDTMEPELVRRAMNEFKTDPATDILCWCARRHRLDGRISLSKSNPVNPGIEHHIVHAFLSTARYASRLGFFLTTGGWNREAKVWDDWELGVRIMLRSPRIKVINEVWVNVFSQVDSITGMNFSSKAGKWEETTDLISKSIALSGRKDRMHLERAVCYRRAILAAKYNIEGRRDLATDLMLHTLRSPVLSRMHRNVLRAAYHHTRLGLRGAYTLCTIRGKLL